MNIPETVARYMLKPHESKSLHPSGCTRETCVRQEMYRIQGRPMTNPPTAESLWRLRSYTLYEHYLTEAMHASHPGAIEQYEVSYNGWHGKLDQVIPVQDGDPWLLVPVEIKSVNPGALQRNGMPYGHQIDQLLVYLVLGKKLSLPFADYGLLVYIERWNERAQGRVPRLNGGIAQMTAEIQEPAKGVPAIVQYRIASSKRALEETEGRMWQWETWTKDEKLPPRPYGTPFDHPWNCVYQDRRAGTVEPRCPYLSACWPDWSGRGLD